MGRAEQHRAASCEAQQQIGCRSGSAGHGLQGRVAAQLVHVASYMSVQCAGWPRLCLCTARLRSQGTSVCLWLAQAERTGGAGPQKLSRGLTPCAAAVPACSKGGSEAACSFGSHAAWWQGVSQPPMLPTAFSRCSGAAVAAAPAASASQLRQQRQQWQHPQQQQPARCNSHPPLLLLLRGRRQRGCCIHRCCAPLAAAPPRLQARLKQVSVLVLFLLGGKGWGRRVGQLDTVGAVQEAWHWTGRRRGHASVTA